MYHAYMLAQASHRPVLWKKEELKINPVAKYYIKKENIINLI